MLPGRRDSTKIQLLVISQLMLSGGRATMYTKNGLMFKLGVHQRTLQRAINELQRQGVIRSCKVLTPAGREVLAVEFCDEAQRMLKSLLPTIDILT
jgi:DNA-binding transcriptional regulator YhcF (GntR family)